MVLILIHVNTSFPYHYCHFHVISVALMSITIVSETTMKHLYEPTDTTAVQKASSFPFNHKNETSKTSETAVADTGFSVGGGADPRGGANIRFCQNFRKTA